MKAARDLVPGDIVASGEAVLSVDWATQYGKKTMIIKLQKNDKIRVASWGYYSNIHMQRETACQK